MLRRINNLLCVQKPKSQEPEYGIQTIEPEDLGNGFNKYTFKNHICMVPQRYKHVFDLSKGSFGYVLCAYDSVSEQDVVIKKLVHPFDTPKYAERTNREFNLLKAAKHKNVISLSSAYTPDDSPKSFKELYLVMPKVHYTLADLIDKDAVHFSHKRVASFTYQILLGLNYLHENGIIHRDLKPGNIVVYKDGLLKIIDFGMARMHVNEIMSMDVATLCYQSPELLFKIQYGYEVDIWAVGCIVYEMFAGRILLPGRSDQDQAIKTIKVFGTPEENFLGQIPFSTWFWIKNLKKQKPIPWKKLLPANQLPEAVPKLGLTAQNARELIDRLLQIDPEKRCTVRQALEDKYLDCVSKEDDDYQEPLDKADYADKKKQSVKYWKEKTFVELKEYENRNNSLAL